MSLVTQLKAAMVTARKSAGDTVTSFSYRRVTIGDYDPALDAVTTTETAVPLTEFVYGLTDQEVDYFEGDLAMQKFIVNYDALGFTPEETDYVVIDGVNWQVTKTKPFPGGNIGFIVYIRRT